MNISRIDDIRPSTPDTFVTVKQCGNIIEVRYMRYKPVGCPIEKLSADIYVDKITGEIKNFQHKESRINDKSSVAQSLARLRGLINCNLTNPNNALWVTLTYSENMTDTVRLYEDYRRFWQRFCYYLKKQGYPKVEYIIAAEPQARGAWHLHCLFCFPKKAPFIPNDDIARIWKQGFTKTQSLKGIDNVGLYLTAYLGDMELTEALNAGITKGRDIREVEATDEQGKKQKKAIIKGGRLALYPAGFNIYRTSRKIKRPIIFTTTEEKVQEIIGNAPQIYEKTISITDETGEVKNIINYRQYNKAKK
uniref:Replication-associated protein ORF2/G2P domain-containing protein n=1 Tax=uncultured Bacillota bacterium TaxID=344338 RepID=A0A650EPC0_9FIRM|nr:hypothetical protein Firmicute1046_1540 [uncultured Firmicutes bacterium]